ncbi:MAG: hypothetical protein ACXVGB_00020 [Mycobacteriaceae bacterium]
MMLTAYDLAGVQHLLSSLNSLSGHHGLYLSKCSVEDEDGTTIGWFVHSDSGDWYFITQDPTE